MGKLFDALSTNYQQFVAEYIVSGNASEGARKAGSKAKNLAQAGKQLLIKADIQAAITELQAEVAEKLKATPERVLGEHARIGFSDIRRLFNSDGQLLPLNQLDDDVAAAVQSVKVVTRQNGSDPVDVEYVHEIRLWNKGTALEALSKHLGLFERDNGQKNIHTVIVHDPSDPDSDGDA